MPTLVLPFAQHSGSQLSEILSLYSFTRSSNLPYDVKTIINSLKESTNVRDENNKPIKIAEATTLTTQLGSQVEMLAFYVTEKLTTAFILASNFCDRRVEAICPRKWIIELYDGTAGPMFQISNQWKRNAPSLPIDQ